MTKDEKAKVLQALFTMALVTGQEPSEARFLAYVEQLKDLPVDDALQGIHHVGRAWVYNTFPPVGAIRQAIGLDKTPEKEAEEVWYAIRNWPWKKPLKDMPLEGPALEVVKVMGGRGNTPTSFGCWSADQENFKKKEFIGRYVALQSPQVAENGRISHQEAQEALNGFMRDLAAKMP